MFVWDERDRRDERDKRDKRDRRDESDRRDERDECDDAINDCPRPRFRLSGLSGPSGLLSLPVSLLTISYSVEVLS